MARLLVLLAIVGVAMVLGAAFALTPLQATQSGGGSDTVRITAAQSPTTTPTSIIQKKSGSGTAVSTLSITLDSATGYGNMLIVACGNFRSAGQTNFNTPTDTQSNVYVSQVSKVFNTQTTQIWAITTLSTTAPTITITTVAAASDFGCNIYETVRVIGLSLGGVGSSSASSSFAIASSAFVSKPVFIMIVASNAAMSGYTAGSGFTADATGNSLVNGQSSVTGITSPTTCPSSNSNVVAYAASCFFATRETSTTLTFSLTANTNYVFQTYLSYTTGATVSLNFDIDPISSGTTFFSMCLAQTDVNSPTLTTFISTTFNKDVCNNAQGITNGILQIDGTILVGSTGGTFTLNFYSASQLATAPSLKAGSFMVLQTVT